MREFTSFLAPLMRDYVAYQTASDRLCESWESTLLLFDRYCRKHFPEAVELSQEMSDSWCRQRETEANNSCISRITPIISFIRYLRRRGKTEVMEPPLPRKERRTYIPHAFTEGELKNFFSACDEIPASPKTREQMSRRVTVPVFFRLLYSSGMRTYETRILRASDVDLCHGIINVRYSKGHDQHYVVLHDSMLELMRQYDAAISMQCPDRIYFFPAKNGSFHDRAWVQENFRRLWDKYNSSHATAYEFRHNYAIENINSWTDEGFGFDDRMLYLSKSMGHSVLESTKYYYSLVPALADVLESKSDEDFIIPEVKDSEII